MSKILTISGWAQKSDSLLRAVPIGESAEYIDYLPCKDFAEVAKTLLPPYTDTPIVMGWSLGAQLAVRAVAAGYLKPKLLVLFSAPYQYVNGGDIECGAPKLVFKAFTQVFKLTPKKSLQNFAEMMAGKNHHLKHIFETIEDNPERMKEWVRWLKILGEFSCESLDFEHFPRTILFHNEPDPVTPTDQSRLYHARLPESVLEIIPREGHAPHLQAQSQIQSILNREFALVRS